MEVPRRVLIVGLGLGGLACAIACKQAGFEVVVLERAPQITNIGAGIQMPPNSVRVMRHLGLLPKIAEVSTVVESLDMRRYTDGELLCGRDLSSLGSKVFGAEWRVLHRADYHTVLMDEAIRLGVDIKLDTHVQSTSADGKSVTLQDGTTVEADVVVGADGLWSTLRESFMDKPSPPTPTGDLAYRATFSIEQLKALNDPRVEGLCARNVVTLWMGPERHSVFYPVRGGKEFNLVLLRPDNLPPEVRTTEGDISEMRASYEGWDEILTKIISCISTVLKWKLLHHDELETWTQGHAALLGDACHPTLPYQAQGAAMAVEDGAVLGFLLGAYKQKAEKQTREALPHPPTATVPALLKLYEKIRKQRTTVNVRGAYANRHFYHMPDGEEQRRRDEEMRHFDFLNGRSEYNWLDTKYNEELLSFDALEDAKVKYESWWTDAVAAHAQIQDLRDKVTASSSNSTPIAAS